ncbi:AAA family ATPase [Streptomyces aidingensis]|uniref:AAA domain-containing protein n=1 Tax=Streptomyces aidingensis TaxID=910347 RepID=A0A1I1TZD2_9ACTN|nr:AAA family ATPase [Streptomyces aidingensis]SFD61763.1 AAA domain-containing protein [Streptomyces aidingensis]
MTIEIPRPGAWPAGISLRPLPPAPAPDAPALSAGQQQPQRTEPEPAPEPHTPPLRLLDSPADTDEPPPQPDLVFRTLAEVAADVDSRPPRPWLFEPVIVAGDYGVMSAEDKAGKTWAILDAAVSCAAGLPWLGQFPARAPGPVLVFLGEGSDAKLLRRIRAIAAAKDLDQATADALEIVACFRAPQLGDAQHRHLIRRAIERFRPVLVIIDPLYLAAGGANGADLYSMGALLGSIQHIVQEAGASLLISHHWNKTGEGRGHSRSSGVGPGAWGRFLISVAVLSSSTAPETQETTVRLKWAFKGDEIPETETTLIRRVRAADPADLSSPMHYSIEHAPGLEDEDDSGQEQGLAPAARKLLEAVRASSEPATNSELVDRVQAKHGHGLTRTTVSRELNNLRRLGLVERLDPEGPYATVRWAPKTEATP